MTAAAHCSYVFLFVVDGAAGVLVSALARGSSGSVGSGGSWFMPILVWCTLW